MVFLSKKNSSQTLSLFIHIMFLFPAASIVHGEDSDQDKSSMLAFKAKISSDPFGQLSSWNDSAYFCRWSGVTCSTLHRNRVTVLDLQSLQLEGTLSPHVGNLSFLRTLNLQNNKFSREIPRELNNLFRLQNLVLENNSFIGEIPVNISVLSNLQFLSFAGNKLVGKLPPELGLLSKLKILSLFKNNFTGEIPLSFGNLSSLERISLTLNNLQGNIPSSLGKLKRLNSLIIGANRLYGPIPSSLFNLTLLTILSLPVNQLNGSLPHDLGLNLQKLKILRLHTNELSGFIPNTFSNASSLSTISLSNNKFSGKVPAFENLDSLQQLGLDGNNFGDGTFDDLNFLSSMINCSNLDSLVISDNNLGGLMPEFISNFSNKITKIGFGRNRIQGKIPSELGNLISLRALGFETNLLSGTIPSSIGKLQYLNDLFLNGNDLLGFIPFSIGNLSSLGRVNLRLNSLQGSIPSSIGGCENLLSIALSQNNLSGTIPKELLSISSLSMYIVLSENRLTGSLPIEVGKLVNLGTLDISENYLSGEIPENLGSCTSLEGLFMEGNRFRGSIPSQFRSLRGLQSLDLSRNNLSGSIPNFFEDLTILNYLNLSFNSFEGEAPLKGVFSNATSISVSGNTKLCGGIPALNLSPCTSNKSKKKHNLKLIISLVIGIFGLILILEAMIIYFKSRKKRNLSNNVDSSMGASMLKVSYNDLFKATNGFSSSNLIGIGGFGSVYKGILGHEGSVVAIKVLNLEQKGASRSFMAECEALKNIRHRNLVKILTACSSIDHQGNNFKALVYEFMIKGSLEEWLHDHDQDHDLSFIQRIGIAIDVATALDYLHNDCEVLIVHCDLKPSNILLDDDMNACVGDFGLARLCPKVIHQLSSNQTSSIGIKGTIGYAAPEYGMGSEVSPYGDVYSYGILLLEMFSGKRPTDDIFKDGLNLHSYTNMALSFEKVMDIADPELFEVCKEENVGKFMCDKNQACLVSVFKIGAACSQESPRYRMDIKKVIEELQQVKGDLVENVLTLSPTAEGC